MGGVFVAGGMGGESTSRAHADKVKSANSARPQLEVQPHLGHLTVTARFAGIFQPSMCYARGRGLQCMRRIPALCELFRDPRARAADRGTTPCRPRRGPRRRRAGLEHDVRVCTPPIPTIGMRDPRAHLTRPARARRRGRPARTRRRCRRRATARPAAAGASPCRARVDQRDGVGAVGLRGGRDLGRATVQFGVSFTISGLPVSGRTRVEQRRGLPRVGAHQQPGLHVRAGDVELERGDLVARAERRARASRPPRPTSP